MQNVHLSPPDLAPLFGVNVSTIKRWIDRGFLPAQVTTGGHRRVSREQLVAFVAKYPRYASRSYILGQLSRGVKAPDQDWKRYYQALRSNDTDASQRFIEELYIRRIPLIGILERVISRTLEQIGTDWARGVISVYDEHRMSFEVRSHLYRLQQLIPTPRRTASRIALLACVAGEHHELPLQILGLILQQQGWTMHTLGINISTVELTRAMQRLKPTLVCLTKTYRIGGSLDFLNVVAAQTKKRRIRLAYGGNGWSRIIRSRTWPQNPRVKYYPTLEAFEQSVK